MELANLIIILFLGGFLTWVAELLWEGSSRWVSLLVIAISAGYLWLLVGDIPASAFSLTPQAADPIWTIPSGA